ncbi:uncharacterized protein [Diadema setosum]|uniref:uncharacterized protein n=1 Tax=Diadema setosum TaxID=31175 RepID=UPI003B3A1AAA
MEESSRRALVTDVQFYITAALVTLLAIVISFKWVYRKTKQPKTSPAKHNVCPVHHTGSSTQSVTEDKSQQVTAGDGDGSCRYHGDSIPEEEEEGEGEEEVDIGDIGDVLINHEDIKPVSASQTEALIDQMEEDKGAGGEESTSSREQHLAGPQKTKKLVEEVSRMMSDEQKQEERRIQSEQLEAIFKLVQEQSDTFGINSLQDIQDQFKLYA